MMSKTANVISRKRSNEEYEILKRVVHNGNMCERLGWVCVRVNPPKENIALVGMWDALGGLWESYPDHRWGGPVSMLACSQAQAVAVLTKNAGIGQYRMEHRV